MLALCQHPNGSGLAPKPPENHRYWKLNLRLEVDLLNVHVGRLTITFTSLQVFLLRERKMDPILRFSNRNSIYLIVSQ